MTRLTVATGNPHKLMELTRLVEQEGLPERLTLVLPQAFPDGEETGQTFLENALLKARSVAPARGSDWVLAEDSGLVTPVLTGRYGLTLFPGLYSNRWLDAGRCYEILREVSAGESPSQDQKNRALLVLMADQTERAAHYVCGMVIWDAVAGAVFAQAEARMPLTLAHAVAGEGGFGYDPVTIPTENNPQGLTTAQLPAAFKQAHSHRAKAFREILLLLEFLGAGG